MPSLINNRSSMTFIMTLLLACAKCKPMHAAASPKQLNFLLQANDSNANYMQKISHQDKQQ
eukprot:scaffold43510_cov38-Prasinocladus_malaysianus.AAC.1